MMKAVLVALFALTLMPCAGLAQTNSDLPLAYGITGEVSQTGRRDPGHLLGQLEVQQLVIAMAEGPLGAAEVVRRLEGADADVGDLVATGILRALPGDRYGLALNFLTIEDQQRIRDMAMAASESLAAHFLARSDRFGALMEDYDLEVDRPALTMALIGAVVLDWDGLGITASDGYRESTAVQPTGDRYLPWARERGSQVSVRGLYWGSHNVGVGGATLTSFGDHHSLPRVSLPDLAWLNPEGRTADGLSDTLRNALFHGAENGWDGIFRPSAKVMIALREGPVDRTALAENVAVDPAALTRVLDLLEAIHFVRRDEDLVVAAVPVLTAARDAEMVASIRSEGERIVSDWLAAHYADLRDQLSQLSAMRAGVPFERLFTQIWHDIFGWTNYRLSRAGLLADPYGPLSPFKGFQPFVWENELDLRSGTQSGR